MINNYKLTLFIAFLFTILLVNENSFAQKKKNKDKNNNVAFEEEYFNVLKWRCIGPFRGGRSAAVTGVPNQANVYFFGATGGGVWKSIDAGGIWTNISDGYFGGSIGAIAVSESDPNVIYVGGGEKTVRGNVSHGDGMWKSVDGGKTWKFIGLPDSRHITRIRIHPENPDVVYVAVLGHLFGANEERGVFRSKDGGETWEKVLFVNENAGAVDLILDPNNPRILYASTWRVLRTPYNLESGGEGSALWKSTDAGDTWTNLNEKSQGLPKDTLGIIGVTVSPANSERVWAIIENKGGGVFRSDNGGKTWTRINKERKLRQRAWYYTRIYADTKNPDIVYVLNVRFHRSKDGGKTFESIATPHGDHHDLWIAPENPDRMIIGDDGGGQVSLDGGKSWSTYMNQPTAQFYRVTTDNNFPYRIYGGQQDNSTIRILSQSNSGGITERHWEPTAGGESAHIAPHPQNPDIVFGGSYGGFLTRRNHQTGETRAVDIYPNNHMGWGAAELKYRFQWNFPIIFSKHKKNTLYVGANVLFKSTNEGQSWEEISPDLTRDDKTKQQASGGSITKDNTSVEYYCTIFAIAESNLEKDVIWVGSDDGLIHITRDGGNSWENITPPKMPEWSMINCIDAHPTIAGGAYVAATRYKLDDFKPYLYKTTDYGKTWTEINNGIDEIHFTRAIRADPEKEGLLYVGTERGVYISFDDGENWQPLQLNLPIVPITDLAIKENDLIAATQGRSFWILDDLNLLHQLSDEVKNQDFTLFKPDNIYNMVRSSWGKDSKRYGTNPANGAAIYFYLKEKPDSTQEVTLEILEENGNVIKTFTNQPDPKLKKAEAKKIKLKLKKGSNRFVWDMYYEDALKFDGLILWAGGTKGPRAIPNKYQVRLNIGGESQTQGFEIKIDPRSESTQEDLQAQFDFLMSIQEKLNETHKAIIDIRKIKNDLADFIKKIEGKQAYQSLKTEAKKLQKRLTEIEQELYQTKNQSRQDPLNYPVKLNNKLSALASLANIGNYRPTDQMLEVRDEIRGLIDTELSKFYNILMNDIPAFNQKVQEMQIPVISVD